MASPANTKARAWPLFDRILREAAPGGVHSNPWVRDHELELRFEPDFLTLEKLLGVPLHSSATTQSGVPALALDAWLSYELRRAGFGADEVWPRSTHPRILPATVTALLDAVPKKLIRAPLRDWLTRRESVKGVTSASASILGKNYFKQVDVIITDWATGPELLISTKRMDSSWGNNAANRVEESYGDAKNLRLRHPLAALGFVYGLRSSILHEAPATYEWLADLIGKLGREDDAYHATCLVTFDYDDELAVPEDDDADDEDRLVAAGIEEEHSNGPSVAAVLRHVDLPVSLPAVTIRHDAMPPELAPARFLATMVNQILDVTPVNIHTEARARRRNAS